jgi:hypothetical protein
LPGGIFLLIDFIKNLLKSGKKVKLFLILITGMKGKSFEIF